MDGLPVTVRLIDPPLHEFLPDLTELSVEGRAWPRPAGEDAGRDGDAARRRHAGCTRQNPMLGLRGVRLGLVIPGLFAMQVRAIAEAAAERTKAGGDPKPEIMVPLVGAVQELEIVRDETEQVLAEVAAEAGVEVETLIGTMIEVPRAALTAGQIAEAAEFFSFGTNDLTQMGWGFSRDDVEAAFFSRYLDLGIFGVSPFESLDREGVGRLVRIAVEEGRAARPDLKVGVCGEHGGDPDSVHFFHEVGLDYVSCSPFRVPVARLEAGRAAVAERRLRLTLTVRSAQRGGHPVDRLGEQGAGRADVQPGEAGAGRAEVQAALQRDLAALPQHRSGVGTEAVRGEVQPGEEAGVRRPVADLGQPVGQQLGEQPAVAVEVAEQRVQPGPAVGEGGDASR